MIVRARYRDGTIPGVPLGRRSGQPRAGKKMNGRHIFKECPLCSSHHLKHRWAANDYDVVRWSRCHFIFVNPQPPPTVLEDFYGERYFFAGVPAISAIKMTRIMMNRGPKGARPTAQCPYLPDAIEKRASVGRLLEIEVPSAASCVRQGSRLGSLTDVENPLTAAK